MTTRQTGNAPDGAGQYTYRQPDSSPGTWQGEARAVSAGELPAQRPRCEYRRRRARLIAYGRWQPWTGAAPVREHVQSLRHAGASYRAIGHAASVSPMTVHRLMRGEPTRGRVLPDRIHAQEAHRLLAVTVTAARESAPRRDASGTRLRLRALIAIGHPAVSLAASAGLPPRLVWDIVRGTAGTVTSLTHLNVAALYDRLWDQSPPEHTPAQRRAATAARSRAARNNWPPPMGLDDDRIDDPRYRPRARWRPATCTSARTRQEARGSAATRPTPSASSANRPTASRRRPAHRQGKEDR